MSANLSIESTSSSDVSNVSNISTSSFVASHYNNLQEKGREARKESRIYYLRNFNNWIKSIVIGEILERIKKDYEFKYGINVLDIGCGKGGDLLKYHIGRIDHIVCTDIAETSLEQCKQRYNDMRNKNRGRTFTADFIHADSTRDRLKDKFQNRDIIFDLVSIQFSFHYCFESLPQAECMIRNASESLRPGGYFIGTTPDAFEIVKRLRNSDSHKFGNDVYSVAFDEEYSDKNVNIPLFGTKYNFHLEGVVDCPEFLVYFPVLVEICKKYHLHLVFKERFDDYFRKHQSRDDLNLIRRMDGLECYSKGKNNLMGSKDDYKHCEEFISKLNSNEQDRTQVGTISASEWEAITLYTIFAFQKDSPDTSKPDKRQKV